MSVRGILWGAAEALVYGSIGDLAVSSRIVMDVCIVC